MLEALSLDIEEGLTTVVIGASGIGKSVLLKCVTGLLRPQSGSISIDGEEVVGAQRKRTAGHPEEDRDAVPGGGPVRLDDVYENVAFPLVYHKSASPREIENKVHAYLDLVGMRDSERAMPTELSGGMKRKVAIARAMILEPRYLLYDEPTAGLDPESSAIVESMIKRLQRSGPSRRSWSPTTSTSPATSPTGSPCSKKGGLSRSPGARTRSQGSPVYEHFIEKRERIRQENAN